MLLFNTILVGLDQLLLIVKSHFQRLHTTWKKRFGEDINEDLLYIVTVERILQIDDFGEVQTSFSALISIMQCLITNQRPVSMH